MSIRDNDILLISLRNRCANVSYFSHRRLQVCTNIKKLNSRIYVFVYDDKILHVVRCTQKAKCMVKDYFYLEALYHISYNKSRIKHAAAISSHPSAKNHKLSYYIFSILKLMCRTELKVWTHMVRRVSIMQLLSPHIHLWRTISYLIISCLFYI